ncbi:uncharacterized protein LOC113329071 [Papaver somniferum]|uniref:uncharacterized protein LOC113329071 n=1 Tax=Papaver somniferum TaxID=3469 RepID=UPI000E7023F9|nr:uncharacterized protein LOC113329071 [Papaver somniferum]
MDRVIYIKEVKRAWDGLISYYQGSDKVKKVRLQTLKRKYELLQMETIETISEFFSKTLNLVNEIKVNGDTIEDSSIVEKILRSLPEKFESKVTAIEECNTFVTMTLDELLGSLQAYEQILLEKTAAALKRHFRVKLAGEAIKENLMLEVFKEDITMEGDLILEVIKEENQLIDQKFSVITVEILDTFLLSVKKPRSTTSNNYKENFKDNIAESQEEEEEEEEEKKTENMSLDCHTPEEQPQHKWYQDTGCNNHICGRREMFDNLDESVRSSVKFGNNSTIPVIGK